MSRCKNPPSPDGHKKKSFGRPQNTRQDLNTYIKQINRKHKRNNMWNNHELQTLWGDGSQKPAQKKSPGAKNGKTRPQRPARKPATGSQKWKKETNKRKTREKVKSAKGDLIVTLSTCNGSIPKRNYITMFPLPSGFQTSYE